MKRSKFIEIIALLSKGAKFKNSIPILDNFVFSEKHLIYYNGEITKMVEINEAFSDRAFLLPSEIAKTITKYKGFSEIEFDAEDDFVKVLLDGEVKMKYEKINVFDYPIIPTYHNANVLFSVTLQPHMLSIIQKMLQFAAKDIKADAKFCGLFATKKYLFSTNREVLVMHKFSMVDLYKFHQELSFNGISFPSLLIQSNHLDNLPKNAINPFSVTLVDRDGELVFSVSIDRLKATIPATKTDIKFDSIIKQKSENKLVINTRDAENNIKTALSVSKYALMDFDSKNASLINFSCINSDTEMEFKFSLPVLSFHPKSISTITGGFNIEDLLKIIKWENENYLHVNIRSYKLIFQNSILTNKTVRGFDSIVIEHEKVAEYPEIPENCIEKNEEQAEIPVAEETEKIPSVELEETNSIAESDRVDENDWLNVSLENNDGKINPNMNFYEEA